VEARFHRIAYKYGYCENILNRFKERTSLKIPQIYLILDYFIYFLRKITIEKEYINILLFGKLYIKRNERFFYNPRFYGSRTFKQFINNEVEFKNRKTKGLYSEKTNHKEIFVYARKFLKLKKLDSKYLFNLFIEGIIQEILDNEIIKLKNIGIFYSDFFECSQTHLFGKDRNYKKKKTIRFVPMKSFIDELRGNIDEYKISKRLKKVFDFYGFSIKVKKYDK